jgi:hypothetical protein
VAEDQTEQPKKISITIGGVRYKAKITNSEFIKFVEELLEEFDITTNKDNGVDKFFYAYLQLAGKYYKCEKEIENIINSIEL